MTDENHDLAVRILPYDSKSPEIFQKIHQFICDVIPFQIEVKHTGSTAVAGLGGKGFIDILIVAKKGHMRKVVELLESKGYRYNPEAGTVPEKLFVSGPYTYNERELHIHIHITFFGRKEHKDKLLFRDYLRHHSDEAKTYYDLKKQWSTKAGSDGSKYTELKTSYINKVLEKARGEFKDWMQLQTRKEVSTSF